jgi:hypothetical protein
MSDAEAEAPAKRKKGIYVGAPACFLLELEGQKLRRAFCTDNPYDGLYVVGSALQRPDWRDVDVRLMLHDEGFAALFPDAEQHWEFDARWLIITTAISAHLSRATGLPIDFQFHPTSHANERHKGNRNALGLTFARSVPE